MINNTYGGFFRPQSFEKVRLFDAYLHKMIERKCNKVDDLCKRLKLDKSVFFEHLDHDVFITNGYYIAPKNLH
ncbi:hypothetical protein ACWU37_21015 (plasmid) [Photobacterium damselae subsp. damselae]|uniref:hypothetical protein n=1 Tax=Photobacterium damselae TaxID=38293 RepID=UPI001F3A8102|nr:hypothetical protein [Photobacterium damselae]UKA12817.1 hypothetical protein IHC91_21225 [Photobacterium damselae subsp. damselae]